MPMNDAVGLRIAIVSALLHPKYGGPATVMASHFMTLSRQNAVSVFGVVEAKDRPAVELLYPTAKLFDLAEPKVWFRGRGLYRALRDAGKDLDVLHAHMLWDEPVFSTWRVSKELGLPLIVTPHGSLAEKWRHGSPQKRLYRKLIADRILTSAAAVHALTEAEAEALTGLGLKTNTVVIPNGVPDECFQIIPDRSRAEAVYPGLKGRKIVLYLGRLWSEKGLDILPGAWAEVTARHPSAVLVVAGPDYRDYRATFESELERLNIAHSCLITGPVYGAAKTSLLAAADVFVLPSRSEALSMAMIEAAAAGLPMLFTPGCNAQELTQAGGGFEAERSAESLAAKLIEILAMPQQDLIARGARARAWAQSRFNLQAVGDQLCSVYSAALNPISRARAMPSASQW